MVGKFVPDFFSNKEILSNVIVKIVAFKIRPDRDIRKRFDQGPVALFTGNQFLLGFFSGSDIPYDDVKFVFSASGHTGLEKRKPFFGN